MGPRAQSPVQRVELADAWSDHRAWQGQLRAAMGRVDDWRDAALETPNQLDFLIGWCLRQGRLDQLESGPAWGLARLDSALTTLIEPYRTMGLMGSVPLLRASGQVDSARAALACVEEVAERMGFSAWDALIAMEHAELAELEGDLDRALEQRQRAGGYSARATGMLRQIARVHRLRGELGEAKAIMDGLRERSPFGPATHLEAAELALARGDEARAREYIAIPVAAWVEADDDYLPARRARELARQLGRSG